LANGNGILDQLEKDLDELINDPNTTMKEMMTGVLRVQRYTIPYLKQSQVDHNELGKLQVVYGVAVWVISGFGVLLIGLLWAIFTGKAQIVFL
jgi:hypothetical protein